MFFFFFNISCKKITEKNNISTNYKSLKGSCYYIDAINGKAIYKNAKIKITIKNINSNENFIEGFVSESIGYNFNFSPIKAGNYIILAEYFDSTSSILYSFNKTFNVEDNLDLGEIELKGSSTTIFIKGEITYPDLLTGKQTKTQAGLVAKISSFNESIELVNNGNANMIENRYSFGPLDTRKYRMLFSYNDKFGINYTKEEIISIDSLTSPITFKNLMLNRELSTLLIANVADTFDNPVSNVKVFLYDNYILLKKYKDNSEVALASAITNNDGQAVFINLKPVKYYIYAMKGLPNDTLTNSIDSLTFTSVNPLLINQINLKPIKIQ